LPSIVKHKNLSQATPGKGL